ncbi:MAG: hypothetical protein FJX74_00835 [Armatimonadetes bacterium]|nr:hypothetical protein [Armatimonadota bacterium]
MARRRLRKRWLGLGAAAVAIVVALVWSGVNGLRLKPPEPSPRPSGVLPPTETLPIALWSETLDPVVNLQGDVWLGYEKLPRLNRQQATARVVLELLDERGAAQPVVRMFVDRPLPGGSGRLALGAILTAVNQQQSLSARLSGDAQLVITLGDRDERKEFRPLSNEVAVPCAFQ